MDKDEELRRQIQGMQSKFQKGVLIGGKKKEEKAKTDLELFFEDISNFISKFDDSYSNETIAIYFIAWRLLNLQFPIYRLLNLLTLLNKDKLEEITKEEEKKKGDKDAKR